MRISDWSSDVCSSDLLIEIAAENEKLMERVHALTVALLRANTMEVTARTVIAKLSADFHTEQVRLLLFGDEPQLPRADWLQQIPGGAGALPEFAEFLHKGEPVSGRLSAERSEDRRVGQECVSTCKARWATVTYKNT